MTNQSCIIENIEVIVYVSFVLRGKIIVSYYFGFLEKN